MSLAECDHPARKRERMGRPLLVGNDRQFNAAPAIRADAFVSRGARPARRRGSQLLKNVA
jgi:hypothetical protein